MFGFAAVAETPFSAELTKYTIGVDLADVSAASALNSPQFSGGVNLPALTGVSATLTNATLDINGKANITTANVASTTSIAALTLTAEASDTSGIMHVHFFVTEPRESDGKCTGNGAHLVSEIVTEPLESGAYEAALDISGLAAGDYCAIARARDMSNSHSNPVAKMAFTVTGGEEE